MDGKQRHRKCKGGGKGGEREGMQYKYVFILRRGGRKQYIIIAYCRGWRQPYCKGGEWKEGGLGRKVFQSVFFEGSRHVPIWVSSVRVHATGNHKKPARVMTRHVGTALVLSLFTPVVGAIATMWVNLWVW